VSDVLAAPAVPVRDDMIDKWCAPVWEAYDGSRDTIIELIQAELGYETDVSIQRMSSA
jgi:hypothetical protein